MKQNLQVFASDLCILCGDMDRNITEILSRGLDHMEIMMDGPVWEDFPSRKAQLLEAMRRHPAQYSLHGPCYDINLASENRPVREACLRTYLDAVEFAGELGCAHLVIHPGFCQSEAFDRDRCAAWAHVALEALCKRARECGVQLAVENVGLHFASLYTYDSFIHLLDDFGDEAAYLVDIGHALINGWDIPALIRQTAGRLCAIHLHDNDGHRDQHLPIGRGIADWEPIYREIAHIPRQCSLVLEYIYHTPVEDLARSKRELEQRLREAAKNP